MTDETSAPVPEATQTQATDAPVQATSTPEQSSNEGELELLLSKKYDAPINGEEQKADGEEAPKQEGEQEKPEEEYVFEYTPPEGYEFPEFEMEKIGDFFKEHKIPKDLVKPLLDKHLNIVRDGYQETYERMVRQWTQEVKNDPEIGGKDLDVNLSYASKAIDELGGDKLRNVLDRSGLSSHPELVKAFVQMGKFLNESPFVQGRNAKPRLSDYDVMFNTNVVTKGE
ncbi:putative protease [Caudoviricetes sp.]|nr:putative protease [Caudoviricetes sp.]